MQVIIDRLEDRLAVVELPDETYVNVPRALFPDAKEGDVISVTVDQAETARRREKIKALMREVWED